MHQLPPAATTSSPQKRWPLFSAGVLMIVLGPVIYIVQFGLKNLAMPWYLPAFASIGVVCMAASAWQRRGAARIAGLVLFGVLCGLEWYAMVFASKTPLYNGPAQPGAMLPAFETTLANGARFTSQDLENGTPALLVFFRGRW